jgi:SNF2 family DNA or RNA helicase
MSEDEEAFYESQRKNAAERVAQCDPQRTMIEMITSLTRLRQAACHPQMVVPSLEIGSAKLECLKEILEELKDGGHRALIFSQFVKFLTIVKRWLNEKNFTYEYLDGSTTAKKRVNAIDAFQNGDADLFLISTKAGGFGLNLTGADYVIHLDPWWNPAVEDQASDRAHRIGQTKPVTVYKIVTKNSVEEKIIKMHGDKRTLAKGLLEGTGKIASMDMKQLLELLK